MKISKFIALTAMVIIFLIINNNVIDALDSEGKILENVYVENINVSGLTKKEATDKINTYIKNNCRFELYSKGKNTIVDMGKFNVDYNVPNLVEKAYNIGRDKDMVTNIKTKLSLKNNKKKAIIPLTCSYNIKDVDSFIEDIYSKNYIEPISASAKIVNKNIVISKECYGQAVDKMKLKDIILYKIENLDSKTTQIPLQSLKPKYTYQQLSKINTLLGSYETYFNPQNKNRVKNIKLASESTDNIIVDKYQNFSFNQQLKEKNIYSKLEVAPIILNGKHDKGVGGGICQVSTNIYNAVLYAGMDIIEITNHSIPSTYVKKGRDATVCDGYMDFVFKNNSDVPIIIQNQVFENRIITEIYGNNKFKRDIEVKTQIVKIIKNKKIYKYDSKLQKGTKKVEQEGRLGYTVNTFRLYKSNNQILKKELINTSYYPPCDEIILQGMESNSIPQEYKE